jgi:NDP-sugar pyrophosphorylase family protein
MLGDRTIAEHIIDWLYHNGIDEVIIATSGKKDLFEAIIQERKEWPKITYKVSGSPMGTAGQLKHAMKGVKETFVAVYGDGLIDANLCDMISFHRERSPLATIMAMEVVERSKYGFLRAGSEDELRKWEEKPERRGWISVGCFIMEPSFLKYIPEGERYGMDKAFNAAVKAGERVLIYRAEGSFIDLGDKRSYYREVRRFKEKLGVLP